MFGGSFTTAVKAEAKWGGIRGQGRWGEKRLHVQDYFEIFLLGAAGEKVRYPSLD